MSLFSVLGGFAAQKPRIVQPHKRRTADAGCHDVVVTLELRLKLLCQGNSLTLKACIGHRLAATCLVLRILHVKSQVPEQLVGSYAYLRIDRIDVAGDK